MAAWFENLVDYGPTPALTAMLSFGQARHRIIAENVANLGTPGYKAQQLDVRGFQRALGDALDRRSASPGQPFRLVGREFASGPGGSLRVTPSVRPPDNVLFHDGTNASLEREMADLAENALAYQTSARLLETRFEGLRKAIRGRV